ALGSSHSRWLFDNVSRGIGSYENCIGVPTVGGEVEFDTSFERNCLVDVVCLGLGLRDKLVPGGSIRPGYLVYVIGGSTGGDGIQGASFASRTLTERSDSERSAVQVPDPFTKKLIIEAVLEAVDAGIVQGMKDLGGGGLACGLSEMASKAGMGMEINLDNVRIREPGMRPAEIMISESQERMIVIVKSKNEEKLTRILDKWELGYSRIGHLTNDGILRIMHQNLLAAEAPAKFIAEAPLSPRSSRKPPYIDELSDAPDPQIPEDLNATLLALLGNPEVFWTFKEAIRAIRDYLKATGVPCIGGKVSFYNEDTQTTTAIKPSPVIAAVGLGNARAPKIGSALAKEGNDLLIVGTTF